MTVALAAYAIHELGHAFGLLGDEYVEGREVATGRVKPDVRSVLSLSNLEYSDRAGEVAWSHLSADGWRKLTPEGRARSSADCGSVATAIAGSGTLSTGA